MCKLIVYLLLGYLGYQAYDVWSIRQDPVFLKAQQWMQAVWDDDKQTMATIKAQGADLRPQALKIKGQKRWEFDRLLSRTADAKGVETLRINQSLRYDPAGKNTFFGDVSGSILHTIVLECQGGEWKVRGYELQPL